MAPSCCFSKRLALILVVEGFEGGFAIVEESPSLIVSVDGGNLHG
jgi:hypothetical protein